MTGSTHNPYSVTKPPFFRRLTMESLDALRPGHSMMALVELDVTEARKRVRCIRNEGRSVSFFAWIVSAIAQCIQEQPELNAIRWKSRIARFEHVDVSIPVEIGRKESAFPRQIVIRNAASKSAEQISREIRVAQESGETQKRGDKAAGPRVVSAEDRAAQTMMRRLLLVPQFLRRLLMRAFATNALQVQRRAGTTFVTSVGSFGAIPGFVVPYMSTPRAVTFAVGSVVTKPWICDGAVSPREVLSLTVIFNHDIVDGAPAARFTHRLKRRIERGPE